LKDESIAKDIADTLNLEGYDDILEIGPGMGVLTKYLLNKPVTTYVIEIDTESVTYLDETYPKLKDKIISQDFLRYNINEILRGSSSLSLGISILFRHKLF
jgi:16S rRNA (adenine1518-N6/adenine1519-N6)-dimethyltransferase